MITERELAQALLTALNQPGISVPESVCQAALRLQDQLGRNAARDRTLELLWAAMQHCAQGHGMSPWVVSDSMCEESACVMLSPVLLRQLESEARLAITPAAEAAEVMSRFTQ